MPSNPDRPTRTYLPLCNVRIEARNALDLLDPRANWKDKDQKMPKHIKANSHEDDQGYLGEDGLLPDAPNFSNTMVASTRLSALAALISFLAAGGMFVESAL